MFYKYFTNFTLFILFLIIVIIVIVYFKLPKSIKCNFAKKHVLITGASKGIGKAIAIEVLKRNCSCLTIVARNEKNLVKAVAELRSICKTNQIVQYFQLDVSKDYQNIKNVVQIAEKNAAKFVNGDGSVDILINNAGNVLQGAFSELDINAFEEQIKTNFFSVGYIAFVSSAAGQCAFWGYSAYSSSKFAIRGFADALFMELMPFNIGVSILYPPNTKTEGFKKELKNMPLEIREITQTAGIFSASEVALKLIKNMEKGAFGVSVGLEGWMLNILTAGASPETSFFAAITQIFLSGIFRGIMLIYIGLFNSIVQRCHKNKIE